MIALVIVEMIIALVTFNIAFSGLYDLWVKDNIYDQMELSKTVAFTLNDYDNIGNSKTYNELKNNNKFTLLGETQTGINTKSRYIVPLSEDFINNIKKPKIKGEWFKTIDNQTLSAVISNSLTDKYKIGNTYKFEINNTTFSVYISGALKSDYMFIPPSGASDIIQKNNNFILVDNTNSLIKNDNKKSSIVTAYINGNIDDGINYLESNLNIKNVISVSSAKLNDEQIQLKENAIPIILTIAVIFMCIAGFASCNVLSIVHKEKQFAIFFLTGATHKKCIIIQLLEDIITIIIPICLAFIILNLLKMNGIENAFCDVGIVISILICMIIFFITSFSGLLRLSKKEPIEIIRQW
jgi:hypothetical protein